MLPIVAIALPTYFLLSYLELKSTYLFFKNSYWSKFVLSFAFLGLLAIIISGVSEYGLNFFYKLYFRGYLSLTVGFFLFAQSFWLAIIFQIFSVLRSSVVLLNISYMFTWLGIVGVLISNFFFKNLS